MSDQSNTDPEDRPEDDRTIIEENGPLSTLSETAKRFLEDPDVDEPVADDASGVEVPQDGDPGR